MEQLPKQFVCLGLIHIQFSRHQHKIAWLVYWRTLREV